MAAQECPPTSKLLTQSVITSNYSASFNNIIVYHRGNNIIKGKISLTGISIRCIVFRNFIDSSQFFKDNLLAVFLCITSEKRRLNDLPSIIIITGNKLLNMMEEFVAFLLLVNRSQCALTLFIQSSP